MTARTRESRERYCRKRRRGSLKENSASNTSESRAIATLTASIPFGDCVLTKPHWLAFSSRTSAKQYKVSPAPTTRYCRPLMS